jgi:hypothetical protein
LQLIPAPISLSGLSVRSNESQSANASKQQCEFADDALCAA